MIALTVIGAIALLIVFLLSLKLTLTVAYSEEVTLCVKLLFIKLYAYPKKEKRVHRRSMSEGRAKRIRERMKKKQAKRAAVAKEKKERRAQHKLARNSTKKRVLGLLDSIELVCKLVSTLIRLFVKHLRIKVARIKITVATGDAAQTAITYAAVTQSINLLLPALDQLKHVDLPHKEADLDVTADFLGESSTADVEISFSLRVWQALAVALGTLKTYLKHKLSKPQARA